MPQGQSQPKKTKPCSKGKGIPTSKKGDGKCATDYLEPWWVVALELLACSDFPPLTQPSDGLSPCPLTQTMTLWLQLTVCLGMDTYSLLLPLGRHPDCRSLDPLLALLGGGVSYRPLGTGGYPPGILVPTSDGGHRPILNLKFFNLNVWETLFKMEML